MMNDTEAAPKVTDEQAEMLAQHAIFVQGGYSTPERERERAEKALAEGETIDFDRMAAEVRAELLSRITAMGTAPASASVPATAPASTPKHKAPEPTGPQRVEVTAVMADIDSAVALRKRIKALQTDLKDHEQSIKDFLGTAAEGVDSTGKVVVTYPTRNRTNLVATKVREKLSPEDYAECQVTTSYRPLLFDGE
jgi:hypothetical protein